MTSMTSMQDDELERRRRARRTAIALGFVALAFYVGFILMNAYVF